MIKSTKKILFDAGPMANGPKSGVGYYSFGLVTELAKSYPNYIFIGHYFDFLGRKKNLDLPQNQNIKYKRSIFLPGKLINLLKRFRLELPFELLSKSRGDFIIFPAYSTLPSLFKTPMIVAIHDLAFMDCPETVAPRNLADLLRNVPRSISRSSFILTISNATKKRIEQKYKPQKPIVITHIPPVKLEDPDRNIELNKLGIDGKYILFIGNLEPRKNITRLVEAYCKLSSELLDEYSLVLAGGSGWNNEDILRTIEQKKSEGYKIISTGYVSDTERTALFFQASALAFISLYEGFGMPILEAMQAKIPVLASDIPVLREVGDDSVLYCNPLDLIDISNKMHQILVDEKLRKSLIESSRKRLEDFTWEKCTGELRKYIEETISN